MDLEIPTPGQVEEAQKRMQIMNLRISGWSMPEISNLLQIPEKETYSIVLQQLQEWTTLTREQTEEMRTLELERLDAFLKSLWPKVISGSPKAIEVALKITERRAKLSGLDAPEKSQIQVESTVHQLNHAELLAEYSRLGLNPSPPKMLDMLPGENSPVTFDGQ
jgi:hypothetical protein